MTITPPRSTTDGVMPYHKVRVKLRSRRAPPCFLLVLGCFTYGAATTASERTRCLNSYLVRTYLVPQERMRVDVSRRPAGIEHFSSSCRMSVTLGVSYELLLLLLLLSNERVPHSSSSATYHCCTTRY